MPKLSPPLCCVHEGIVPVYASGEYEGNPYFSMAYIEGTTLAELIAKSPIDGRTAAKLLSSIADAVKLRTFERRYPSRPEAKQYPC